MISDYWGRRLEAEMCGLGQEERKFGGWKGPVFEDLCSWHQLALEGPLFGHFVWVVFESQPFRAGIILLDAVSNHD